MNTFSLYVILLCLPAISLCIPIHVSSQYAMSRLGFGGGESNSFGGGQSSSFGGGQSSSFGGGQSSSFGGGQSNSYEGGLHEATSSSFGGISEGGEGDQHHGHHHEHHHEEYHEPKPYGFGYAVKDFKKGTSFSQHESSDGHNIKGEYEVALPDGRLQIVKYNADWKNGFNADVKYHGESHHPEVYATHESSGLDYKHSY